MSVRKQLPFTYLHPTKIVNLVNTNIGICMLHTRENALANEGILTCEFIRNTRKLLTSERHLILHISKHFDMCSKCLHTTCWYLVLMRLLRVGPNKCIYFFMYKRTEVGGKSKIYRSRWITEMKIHFQRNEEVIKCTQQ